MSQNNAVPAAEEPLFRALLTPHRSLGRTGFAVLMGALLFGWAVTGAIFLANGAWPVFGFFGLDVLLVYVCFRLNYRAARAREEVTVSRLSLDIRKVAPSGRAESHQASDRQARECQTEDCASGGNHRALRQQLPHQPPAAASDGCANRQLAAA